MTSMMQISISVDQYCTDSITKCEQSLNVSLKCINHHFIKDLKLTKSTKTHKRDDLNLTYANIAFLLQSLGT